VVDVVDITCVVEVVSLGHRFGSETVSPLGQTKMVSPVSPSSLGHNVRSDTACPDEQTYSLSGWLTHPDKKTMKTKMKIGLIFFKPKEPPNMLVV
jgi:hypothetical protein